MNIERYEKISDDLGLLRGIFEAYEGYTCIKVNLRKFEGLSGRYPSKNVHQYIH